MNFSAFTVSENYIYYILNLINSPTTFRQNPYVYPYIISNFCCCWCLLLKKIRKTKEGAAVTKNKKSIFIQLGQLSSRKNVCVFMNTIMDTSLVIAIKKVWQIFHRSPLQFVSPSCWWHQNVRTLERSCAQCRERPWFGQCDLWLFCEWRNH